MKYVACALVLLALSACGGGGSGGSASNSGEATVPAPSNHAPVASVGLSVAGVENTSPMFWLSGTDADNDALTFQVVRQPDKCTLMGVQKGRVFILLPTNWNGNDSFTFTCSDGQAVSAPEEVQITISPTATGNTAPVMLTAANLSVNENQISVTTISATDVDNDTLTYTLSGGSDQASFHIDANTGVLTFLAAPDFETKSTYHVSISVHDGTVSTTKAFVVAIMNLKNEVWGDNWSTLTWSGIPAGSQ